MWPVGGVAKLVKKPPHYFASDVQTLIHEMSGGKQYGSQAIDKGCFLKLDLFHSCCPEPLLL